MSPVKQHGSLVCLIIQAIVFVFVVIATPLEMFRSRTTVGVAGCITLWGQRDCSSSRYSVRTFGCNKLDSTMHAGAAFAIISILVTLVALLACAASKFGAHILASLGAKILAIVAIFTILISWACAASAYNQRMCGPFFPGLPFRPLALKASYRYGGGFGLMVTAWCLQVINAILLFFV